MNSAFALAGATTARGRPGMRAFATARRSSVDEVAAIAGYNLGVLLGELDRSEDAVAVYDDVVARFGDATEPILRQAVAMARTALEQPSSD